MPDFGPKIPEFGPKNGRNWAKNGRIWTNIAINFMMAAKLDYVEERLRGDAIS